MTDQTGTRGAAEPRRMRLIELYGGPGIGKSTLSLGLAFALKAGHEPCALTGGLRWARPVAVEVADEEAAWQVREVQAAAGDARTWLGNQLRLGGAQLHRLEAQAGSGTEIVVTDSPMLLCAQYARPDRYPAREWRAVLRAHYDAPLRAGDGSEVRLEVLPVLLRRVGRPHDLRGRVHDAAAAARIDAEVEALARSAWGDALLEAPATTASLPALVRAVADRGWLGPLVCGAAAA